MTANIFVGLVGRGRMFFLLDLHHGRFFMFMCQFLVLGRNERFFTVNLFIIEVQVDNLMPA